MALKNKIVVKKLKASENIARKQRRKTALEI
jgi:hypothetical protein